jgi:hypothetical protein
MINRDESFDIRSKSVWDKFKAPTTLEPHEKLDEWFLGEWDLTLETLRPLDSDHIAIKARLQILGVIREGVGTAATYEAAAEAAFLRAAKLFGYNPEGAK